MQLIYGDFGDGLLFVCSPLISSFIIDYVYIYIYTMYIKPQVLVIRPKSKLIYGDFGDGLLFVCSPLISSFIIDYVYIYIYNVYQTTSPSY